MFAIQFRRFFFFSFCFLCKLILSYIIFSPKVKHFKLNSADASEIRYVAEQPLVFLVTSSTANEAEQSNKAAPLGTPNIRKVDELPYHLAKCERWSDLAEQCLCKYDFLRTKLGSMGMSELLQDFKMLPPVSALSEAHKPMILVRNVLRMMPFPDPNMLAGQLLGRLQVAHHRSKPYVGELLSEAQTSSLNPRNILLPLNHCLAPPTDCVNFVFQFQDKMYGSAVSPDGR